MSTLPVRKPRNRLEGYDYSNTENYVWTDCFDWKPDGSGDKEYVNCEKWGCTERGYDIYWMQSFPGYDNTLVDNGYKLKNWWDFIGDFDAAIAAGKNLVYP